MNETIDQQIQKGLAGMFPFKYEHNFEPDSLLHRTQRAIDQARFFVPEKQECAFVSIGAYALVSNSQRQAVDAFKARVSGRGLAISGAERNRLVRASKCPTREKQAAEARKNFETGAKTKTTQGHEPKGEFSPTFSQIDQLTGELLEPVFVNGFDDQRTAPAAHQIEIDGSKYDLASYVADRDNPCPVIHTPVHGAGRFTVVTHREWSGDIRIRTQVDLPASQPPAQSGPRITSELSLSGAVAISDSCQYLALKHGGYKTFLTLTLDDDARNRIASGSSTIQKETSRFFDGLQKMYQRGWIANGPLGQVKVPGHDHKLKYCWVAENPKNNAGEDNPHLHVLMSWKVPFALFESWAERIEGIWGQGFAHLEKIKDPINAGAYMAKAAGYITKSSGQSDQGKIRGNRYGISTDARAPAWACIGKYELGIMGSLIADVHDFMSFKYGHIFHERKELNGALDSMKAQHKAAKASGVKIAPDSSKRRAQIGQKLQQIRAKINDLPIVASKYQLLIKGKENFEKIWEWATTGNRGGAEHWLPIIDQTETWNPDHKPDGLWYGEFLKRTNYRRQRQCEQTSGWWDSLCDTYDGLVENQIDADYSTSKEWDTHVPSKHEQLGCPNNTPNDPCYYALEDYPELGTEIEYT